MNKIYDKPYRAPQLYDRPYRSLPSYDIKKVKELFNIVENLNTTELLQYSINTQIPLDVIMEENGDTLIHTIIKMDNKKTLQQIKMNVINFLYQNGCNPDIPNKMNQTPLLLACNFQLDIIIEYLLKIKADPNFIDSLGYSPFHYLFFGEIKTITQTNKIEKFIKPSQNRNIDLFDKKNIIEIKKKL